MRYTFFAVLKKDGDEIIARVPDIPGCITFGSTYYDAIEQITDAASGCLVVLEDEGAEIKEPTPQSQIAHDPEDILSLINIDTMKYRALTDTKSVRKNVSLPRWMATLGDKQGVNYSKILQAGLMKLLNG